MIWLVVLTLSALSLAAPQLPVQQEDGIPAGTAKSAGAEIGGGETPVAIVSQTAELGGDGSYNFSFDTADGVHRDESGFLKTSVPPPEEGAPEDFDGTAQVQQGSFSYTAPDGILYKLTYIADENGFRVQGDHLPTAPPVPGDRSANAVTVPPPEEERTTIAAPPLPLQTESP